jgi:transcriptional regulator with XRE-family HTH domain
MIRQHSGRPVTGRPDAAEQAQLAAGLGALLRGLRQFYGIPVRDLETRSGVSRSTISRLEHGLRRPRRSVLGWLAWGLDAENVTLIKDRLCEAAGDSLVCESRWSERLHVRRLSRQLARGGVPVPMALLAPYAVAALGAIIPDELDRLRTAEELASRGEVPWPPGMTGSTEALAIAGVLADASARELAGIGRSAVAVNDYAACKDRKRRERARRAAEREAFAASRARRAGTTGDVLASAIAFGSESDRLLAVSRAARRQA